MKPAGSDQGKYRRDLGFRIALAVGKAKNKQAAAAAVGVTPEQLNKWIRGQVKVPAEALKSLAETTQVDFSWLVTGKGDSPFRSPYIEEKPLYERKLEAPVRRFDNWLMRRLATIVTTAYRERNLPISPENVAVEAAALYNELFARVSDMADEDEISLVLPQLRHLLLRRLDEAEAEPGSGKASA